MPLFRSSTSDGIWLYLGRLGVNRARVSLRNTLDVYTRAGSQSSQRVTPLQGNKHRQKRLELA